MVQLTRASIITAGPSIFRIDLPEKLPGASCQSGGENGVKKTLCIHESGKIAGKAQRVAETSEACTAVAADPLAGLASAGARAG